MHFTIFSLFFWILWPCAVSVFPEALYGISGCRRADVPLEYRGQENHRFSGLKSQLSMAISNSYLTWPEGMQIYIPDFIHVYIWLYIYIYIYVIIYRLRTIFFGYDDIMTQSFDRMGDTNHTWIMIQNHAHHLSLCCGFDGDLMGLYWECCGVYIHIYIYRYLYIHIYCNVYIYIYTQYIYIRCYIWYYTHIYIYICMYTHRAPWLIAWSTDEKELGSPKNTYT